MNGPDRWRSPDGFDDDATFADIIAHLNDEPAGGEPPAQSVPEGASTDHESAGPSTVESPPVESTGPSTVESTESPPMESAESPLDDTPVRTPQVWRAHEVDDEPEEHFEPPPVSPVPAGDLQFWGIIAGMAGGPLLLLYLVFFHRDASSYWMLTAIAMSVGGFALLVSRLPGNHDDDDDGARL